MNGSKFRDWVSPEGRIGRKKYWLHFVLPAVILTLFEGFFPFAAWAALCVLIVGTVKRFRDFKEPGSPRTGLLMGTIGMLFGSMALAIVIAIGLTILGFMFFMTEEPGSSGLWAAAKMVFLLPIGVMFIVVGFTPGLPTNIETDVEVFSPDQGH